MAAGGFCSPFLWVGRSAVLPSIFLPLSWSCCYFPSCSFPYLCPAWTPGLDIAFHFLQRVLPHYLSLFLFACPSPWWDRLVPCSPVFGSNGLVPSLLTLFLWCCRTWAAGGIMLWVTALLQSWLKLWEFPCPGSCLPWIYKEKDLRMNDSSVWGGILLIGLY